MVKKAIGLRSQKAESVGSFQSSKSKKAWIRVSTSSQLYKVVASLKQREKSQVKLSTDVLHRFPPKSDTWEVMLYQEISKSRYKVLVQFSYTPAQFCALKMKMKSKGRYECVSCKWPVQKPKAEAGGGGSGFESTSFGSRGAADGRLKTLGFMMSRKDPPNIGELSERGRTGER